MRQKKKFQIIIFMTIIYEYYIKLLFVINNLYYINISITRKKIYGFGNINLTTVKIRYN